MDAAVIEAISIGAKLLPSVIDTISSLIKAGSSPEEAEEIVKRNITSRSAEYLAAKAEDEAALRAKHGTDSNPYDPDGAA